jgi:exonuclease SbcC
MILRTIALSGIKGYPVASRLDVAALPEGVIAVTGPNGVGKSTALRVWRAVLDRAARLTLVAQAETRDAWVECSYELGGVGRTTRFSIDGHKAAAEVSVLDDAGAPAFASTSVRAYDAWAATALPACDVFTSALFSAQGEPSFLDKTPAERKAVVLRALGVERLERMAAEARARAEKVRQEIGAKGAAIEETRRRADVGPAEFAHAAALGTRGGTETALAAAREALAHARASHAALVVAYEDAVRARRAAADAQAAFDAAHRILQGIVDERTRHEAVLRDAALVDAAVAALPAAERDVEAARRTVEETRARLDLVTGEAKAARLAAITAKAALVTTERRARDTATAAIGIEGVERHAAELPERTRIAAEAEAAAKAQEAVVEALRDAGADVSARRIETLRDGLTRIASATLTAIEASNYAVEVLSADTKILSESEAAPRKLGAAKSELSRLRENLETARISRDAANVNAEKLTALRALAAQARDAAEAVTVARRAVDDATARERAAEADEGAAREPASRAAGILSAAERVLVTTRTVAGRASEIAAARSALEQIAARETAARATLDERRRARDLAPEPPALPPQPADLAVPEAAVQQAEKRHADAQAAVTRAEAAVEQAREAAARVTAMEAERAALDEQLADLVKLGEDLGTRGLIALLVDAAGPELSEIASALLRECYGPRWSVAFRTTRIGTDGQEIEDFIVEVTDSHEAVPNPRDAREFSGGQRVIIGEAVSLALATIAIRRSGLQGCTLVRDESGAALDEETAPLYPAMLRAAARLAGARRVLFVTHNPALPALCDGRVTVQAGQFRID